ncbi:MAG: stage II sporulation protein D [Clostridia bacterium]|nr:stage II sporulation protein D [Clostridia bacterium]
MKKIAIYFLLLFFVCFILPALLTKSARETTKETTVEIIETNNEIEMTEEYNYNQYGKIKLLYKKSKEIEEIELEDYICNVVSAEMPVSYELEALKAQAIVARTYTIYKIQNKKHEEADICDDSGCCQAWISKENRFARWEETECKNNWDKIEKCVRETSGQIITYEGKPINAFFHSNSGGITEIPINVWGGSGHPYLQVVTTEGEEGYSQYESEVEFSKDELLQKLRSKYNDIQIDFQNNEDIKILEYTDSNRVRTVKFGNYEISGVEARTLLGLKSTNFIIKKEGESIKFYVIGYGHGVGMSQTGADAMAKQGSNCYEIINHFYVGIDIKEVNSL